MSERGLAEAIYAEITSDARVEATLKLWREFVALGGTQHQQMYRTLRVIAADAIDAALARRLSEAARTGPWDAPCDERERCARHIEALAVALRDNGPTTPEGLLTGIAGAQVGVLLDAAASLRTGRGAP